MKYFPLILCGVMAFSGCNDDYNKIKTLNQALACPPLWETNNGRVLCLKCHRKTVTYGNRKNRRPVLSMVVPTYTITSELESMAYNAICSYRKFVDELIIIEDGGMFSLRLLKMANTYIINKKNKGFTKSVNSGWKLARGEYVAIVSSDTYLVSGNPRDLCIERKITSPLIDNQRIDGLAGCFFVVHESCPKYLNDKMKTYYSDEEYKDRTKNLFVKTSSVVIHHLQAQTVTAAGIEGDVKEDREAYDSIS